jgi:WD40 repeat protein
MFTYRHYYFLFLLSLAVLLFSMPAASQPRDGDATLQINPGGHLSQISESIITADGKYIITSSTDKTICIWDIQQKKLLEQIRAPKSVFNQGKIYALALSPDNRLLAVGGFLAVGTETDGDQAGQIRIYDFAARKQLLRFKAHTNVVTSLRFSADGNYLLTGAIDSTLACWKVNKGAGIPSFSLVKKIYREDFFSEDLQVLGNTLLATDRNGITKYRIPNLEKITATKQYQSQMTFIAVNRKTNLMAAINYKQVVLLDTLLQQKQVISLDYPASRLAISPDGNYIITEGAKSSILVFQKKGGLFSKIAPATFAGGNTMLGMGFLSKNSFYVAGGPANILQFYSVVAKNGVAKAKTDSVVAGVGMTFNNVAVYDKKLALRKLNNYETNYDYTLLAESGRLLNFNPADSDLCTKNVWEKSNISIGINDTQTELYIYSGEKVSGTIKRDGASGYFHNAVTITKNNWVISAGSAGFLRLYDTLGIERAAFVGHEGDIFGISESEDGNFLYSTSLDQTTRMWDFREVKDKLEFKKYADLEKVWTDFFRQYFPEYDLSRPGGIRLLFDTLMNTGNKESAEYLLKPQVIQPRLNIFITKNKEWVIWNNAGYFKASANGAAYIGWYVYRGEDRNADFFTADKLYDNYYKPDVINELALSDESTAVILAKVKGGSSLSIAQQVKNMPALRLSAPFVTDKITQKNINLVIDAENKDFISELVLFQNGKRVAIAPEAYRGITLPTISIPVELVTGENTFVLSALNQSKVETTPLKFTLYFAGAQVSSSLYLLVVGIDKYKNSKYNLNYARADAAGIAEQLVNSSKTIFKKILVDSLFDENATPENIADRITKLKTQVKPEDVFLYYYAGHGIMNDPVDNSKPDFYLVLHKVTQMQGNDNMLKTNGMSATNLKELLLEIPAQKQLILFDACNSGGAVNAFARGPGEEAAIFQLARSTGFTVLASTNQEQFAAELKDLKHGIFTYAIINGLKGEADLRKDGKITVKEIELYLNDIIPVLSEKYKGVQQFPQSFSRGMDFPLSIRLGL